MKIFPVTKTIASKAGTYVPGQLIVLDAKTAATYAKAGSIGEALSKEEADEINSQQLPRVDQALENAKPNPGEPPAAEKASK